MKIPRKAIWRRYDIRIRSALRFDGCSQVGADERDKPSRRLLPSPDFKNHLGVWHLTVLGAPLGFVAVVTS